VFEDEGAAKNAISDVRSNETETCWLVFTYHPSAKNTLIVKGTGASDVEALKQHFHSDNICYALYRTTDKIDNSVTVKFVFIIWCGEKVPIMTKAKMTTHKGSITSLIGQYHVDINASELNEISEDIIIRSVKNASGTALHVKDSGVASASSPSSVPRTNYSSTNRAGGAPVSKAKPTVSQGSTNQVTFDEEAITNAIKAVRSDSDECDWCLLGYEGSSSKIILIGKGEDGLEQLLPALDETQVMYGLFRTTDTVDNTVAVKFVLILWVGEKVPIMKKARSTTHKGELLSFIGQYHVDISCSNLKEISEDIIREAVQKASGTAVYYK